MELHLKIYKDIFKQKKSQFPLKYIILKFIIPMISTFLKYQKSKCAYFS